MGHIDRDEFRRFFDKQTTTPSSTEHLRKEIEEQVQAFLDAGGEIKRCEIKVGQGFKFCVACNRNLPGNRFLLGDKNLSRCVSCHQRAERMKPHD